MVARSRDLERNDGWAAGSVLRISDSVVGNQFRPISRPDYRALARYGSAFDQEWAHEFGRAFEAEWRMWADDPFKFCDAAQRMTVTQIFRVALRHKLIDGDALAMLLWNPDAIGSGGARYATTVKLIDPDRLSNPYQQLDTINMRGGVEINTLGAPVAYHIRRAHQNDWYAARESMIWDRFPKSTPWGRPIVVHDFDAGRADQHRGVPVFTPAMGRVRMLSTYDRSQLQQALQQTIFGMFMTSPYDPDDVQASLEGGELAEYQRLREDWHGRHPLTLGGVRIPVLPPGEEPKTVAPTYPGNEYTPLQSAVLRNLAAVTGQSAEQVSWDYSQVNYSSARSAWLEAERTLVRRHYDFHTGFADPIKGGLMEEAMENGRLPLPRGAPSFMEMRAAYMRGRWIRPARGWVDPVAERQGAVLGLDAAFGTLEDECADQGRDYEEVLDQRAVEVRMMRERGLDLPQWAMGTPTDKASNPPSKPASQ